jgi:CRISPR-associated protein Csx10
VTAVLDVTVTTEQRAGLGTERRAGNHADTHEYLPGSVLRGALAAPWVRQGRQNEPAFRRTFDGDLRFGPLLPEQSQIRPVSAHVCKYQRPGCTSTVRDAAFESDFGECATCGRRDPGRGELVAPGGRPWRARQPLTTAAIDPVTQIAADGQLFSRDALPPRTVFRGQVHGPAVALAALAGTHRVRLGGRGSVMGAATVTLQPADQVAPALEPGVTVLVAASPVVLVDDAGRPSFDVRTELRRHGVVLAPSGVRAWIRLLPAGVGGWHAASGLPKPVTPALAAGSTWAVDVDDPAPLQRLLDRGFGLRRQEGFGWVEVEKQAWRPAPAVFVADAVDSPDSYQAWQDHLAALALGRDHLLFVEDLLRDRSVGTDAAVGSVLARPRARGLSEPQRARLWSVLVGLGSEATRLALADWLREQARMR